MDGVFHHIRHVHTENQVQNMKNKGWNIFAKSVRLPCVHHFMQPYCCFGYYISEMTRSYFIILLVYFIQVKSCYVTTTLKLAIGWVLNMRSRLNCYQPTWARPSTAPSHTWYLNPFGPCSTIQANLSLWPRWCPWLTPSSTTSCHWPRDQSIQRVVALCPLSLMMAPAKPSQMAQLL